MVPFKNIKNDAILFIASISIFIAAIVIHYKYSPPEIKLSRQDTASNINRDLLKKVSCGNKRLISSLIWIQTLLQGDEVHYQNKDKNNWMYLRFRTIAEL